MQTLEELLPLFKSHRRTPNGYLVTCPIHEDNSPSLHIANGVDSSGKTRLLVNCFARCDPQSILDYINKNSKIVKNFKPDKSNNSKSSVPTKSSTTATTNFSTLVKIYNYRDRSGKMVYQVLRYANPKSFRFRRPSDDPENSSGFIWSIGDTNRILYNLPEVVSGINTGEFIWKVEGEKDVDALKDNNLIGTCNLFGAGSGKWRPEYTDQLKGANLICIPDEDESGYIHVYEVLKSLIDSNSCKSLRLLFLPVQYKGDVYDYLSKHTKHELLNLADSSLVVTNYSEVDLQKVLYISSNGTTLICNKFVDKSEYSQVESSLLEDLHPTKEVSLFEKSNLFRQAMSVLESEGCFAGLCPKCLGTGFTFRTNGDFSGIVVEDGFDLLSSDDEHQEIKLEKCLHTNVQSESMPF